MSTFFCGRVYILIVSIQYVPFVFNIVESNGLMVSDACFINQNGTEKYFVNQATGTSCICNWEINVLGRSYRIMDITNDIHVVCAAYFAHLQVDTVKY